MISAVVMGTNLTRIGPNSMRSENQQEYNMPDGGIVYNIV